MKRKYFYIVMFVGGATLFVFSLLPFFREFTDTFWVATVIGFVISFLSMFGLMYKPKEKVKLNSRYERKREFITKSEKRFLETLRAIHPEKYEVVPQVALVTVIDKRTNTQYRGELFRVADYCFVDKVSFEPLLLVELNDSSHERADRRERDIKVNAICDDAGLPIVTFDTRSDLSLPAVKKVVMRAILK